MTSPATWALRLISAWRFSTTSEISPTERVGTRRSTSGADVPVVARIDEELVDVPVVLLVRGVTVDVLVALVATVAELLELKENVVDVAALVVFADIVLWACVWSRRSDRSRNSSIEAGMLERTTEDERLGLLCEGSRSPYRQPPFPDI